MRTASLITLLLLTTIAACEKDQKQRPEEDELTQQMELLDAWVRPGKKDKMSAGYLDIYNGTAQTDTLIGVYTPAAGLAEIHESFRQEGGLIGMRPAGKQAINSGDTLSLEPGGFHIMLSELQRTLSPRDTLLLHFEFSESGVKSVEAVVRQQGP
ncbi:MAG: copper chaperone PCu(A)C [Balneolaceae bacterium]|nr:copper chaperone PCu(A)C [Balneolaceae bacterium]